MTHFVRIASLFLVLGPTLALSAPQGETKSPEEAESDENIVSIDFPGGSVAEYIAALKSRNPSINVVIDTDAGKVGLPPVSLKEASVATAVGLIAQAASQRDSLHITVAQPPSKRAPQPSRRGGRPGHGPDEVGNEVYLVKMLRRHNLETRVYSLKDVTDEGGVEKVLAAVDEALGLDASAAKTKSTVKYNAGTSLLFVHGTQGDTAIVEQLLSEMWKPGPELKGDVRKLKVEVTKLKAEVAELKSALPKKEE